MTQTLVFVGTYTTHLPHVAGKAQGVLIYRLDAATGALSPVSELAGQDNPAYLALSPQGDYLYIANEIEEGVVTACAVDSDSGQLTVLNQQPTQGRHPCHVIVHDSCKYVFVANYSSGNFTVYPIGTDGQLRAATAHIQHEGSSVNSARQEAAHAHCIALDAAYERVFVADLGIDRVMIYQFDAANGTVSPASQPSIAMQAGAGPRHLAFHPSRQWLFVINELDSTIAVLAYDRTSGTLTHKQTVSTLPPDFEGENTCAAIHVHPSGNFVYGSNRGHDSIAAFAFDAEAGQLTATGHTSTQGNTPRDFDIDPTGAFLLAANQDSDTIFSYGIDPHTGALSATGQRLDVPTPVCVKMRMF